MSVSTELPAIRNIHQIRRIDVIESLANIFAESTHRRSGKKGPSGELFLIVCGSHALCCHEPFALSLLRVLNTDNETICSYNPDSVDLQTSMPD